MKYIFIILFLSLTACSSLLSPVKTPPVNTYVLALAHASSPSHAPKNSSVLLIATPLAAPGYQTADMIYTQRPFELNHFAQNRWAAPPAEMLAPLLLQRLQDSNCFSAVVTTPFVGNADLILDTRLLNLQQEFVGDKSDVRLAVNIILTDNQTREVVLDKRVEVRVTSEANNPYAGVVAANKAVNLVLNKIEKLICKK